THRVAAKAGALFQFEPERVGLVGNRAAPDRIDGRHHAAVPAQDTVGQRDEAAVGGRGRGDAAQFARDQLPCDEHVSALIAFAGGDVGAGRGSADAGVAMHHQRLGAVPAAYVLRMRWLSGVTLLGRSTRSVSLSSVTTWRASVASTVACRRAREQT